jgi:hypothetical protein
MTSSPLTALYLQMPNSKTYCLYDQNIGLGTITIIISKNIFTIFTYIFNRTPEVASNLNKEILKLNQHPLPSTVRLVSEGQCAVSGVSLLAS